MHDRVLTLAEVAAVTRLPVSTLRYYRHRGVGPKTFKLGRRVVAYESEVLRWVEEERSRDGR